MAVKQELQFRIGSDGTIKLEVKGVKGQKCLELTKELEKELGLLVQREKTSEYYQATEVEHVEIKTSE